MKPKTTPIIIAILIPLVSIVAAISLIYFKKQSLSSFEDFSYAEYLSAPKNLSGNRYTLKAELEMQLANLGDSGRIVSVRDSASKAKFAVRIPQNLSVNAQTKQRYEMNVVVDDKGGILVESMKKY